MMAGNPFGGLFGTPGAGGTDIFSGIATLLNALVPMILLTAVLVIGGYILYKWFVQPKLAEVEAKSIKKFGMAGPQPIGS